MASEEIPILQVKPGMSVAEVDRAAKLRLNYSSLSDNSAIVVDQPVRISYPDPDHGFELPPSRFVWLPQYAGTLAGIQTTTSLAYLDLKSAHETALVLMEKLRAAGWAAVETYPNDWATVERANNRKNPGDELRKTYGKWRLGTVTADVYVKEHSNSPGALPGPQFLPGIDIMDWTLQDIIEKKVFARRQEVNGSVNKTLPLSEWVK